MEPTTTPNYVVDILRFIFSSFWVWAGTAILLWGSLVIVNYIKLWFINAFTSQGRGK